MQTIESETKCGSGCRQAADQRKRAGCAVERVGAHRPPATPPANSAFAIWAQLGFNAAAAAGDTVGMFRSVLAALIFATKLSGWRTIQDSTGELVVHDVQI